MGHLGLSALFTGTGLVVLVISFVVAAFFLWLGAKIVKIKNSGFGKALLATFIGFVAAIILGLIPAIGWLLGLIAYIIIIKYVFATDWGKAILAWLIAAVITAIVFAIVAFAGLFSLGAFMKAKHASLLILSTLA